MSASLAKNELPPYGPYAQFEQLLATRAAARGFEFKQLRTVRTHKSGDKRSRLRGRGMEFAEVRPYQAGDDVRNIDWKVTARTQETYTKLFEEEKERPVFFLVDQTSSMRFGTRRVFKSVLACELAAAMAWSACLAKDRVGALIFDDDQDVEVRPRSGEKSLQHLFQGLISINHRAAGHGADSSQANSRENSSDIGKKTSEQSRISAMLEQSSNIVRPGSIIVILSSFTDFHESEYDRIARLAKHCSVLSIHLSDPFDGDSLVKAAQTDRLVIAPFSDVRSSPGSNNTPGIKLQPNVAAHYLSRLSNERDALFESLAAHRSLVLSASTEKSVEQNLRDFNKQR